MEKILDLTAVTVDNELNPRQGALDQESVLEYSQHIKDLPLMEVFDVPGEGCLLVAGFHRYAAHQLVDVTEARFIVHEGSRDEATEFADLNNLKNGLRLTRSEKRAVIGRYLKRHPERSDVWVAKECHTTDKTVRSVREELENTSEIPTMDKLVDVNGVERPRSVQREPKAESPPPPADDIPEADPTWLDDGFNGTANNAPVPPPPPPEPPKPPPPPPTITELAGEVNITVRIKSGGTVVLMANRGLKTLPVNVPALDGVGVEVQRLVDEYVTDEQPALELEAA